MTTQIKFKLETDRIRLRKIKRVEKPILPGIRPDLQLWHGGVFVFITTLLPVIPCLDTGPRNQ